MNLPKCILLFIFSFTFNVLAEKHDCFPDKRAFKSGFAGQELVTEAQSSDILSRLSALFSQDVAARGGRLDIQELDTDQFDAFADETPDGDFQVRLTKGVRFQENMSVDGYTLIACHEIGHHIGGFPIFTDAVMSVEGEADYFGNLKCMRRYLASLAPNELFNSPAPSLNLIARCTQKFSNATDIRVCARSLQASVDLGEVLDVMSGLKVVPGRLDTPDSSVVSETFEDHPATQCRVDIYRAGALCEVSFREAISRTDPDVGVCNAKVDPAEQRPRCFFAPPQGLILSSN
jgi:hypothetical protein